VASKAVLTPGILSRRPNQWG